MELHNYQKKVNKKLKENRNKTYLRPCFKIDECGEELYKFKFEYPYSGRSEFIEVWAYSKPDAIDRLSILFNLSTPVNPIQVMQELVIGQ